MRRRAFALLLMGVVAGVQCPSHAQPVVKTARLAILSGASLGSPAAAPLFRAFRDQLARNGWEEGRNLIVDAAKTDGKADLFAARAAELVARSPDVIVATNSQAVAAAMAQTSSVPIVMLDVSHPVEAGFVQSLASPGSNVTGVTNQGKDIAIKHYDLVRELNPQVQRVGLVFTPSNVGSSLGLKEQTVTAHERGIAVVSIPFEGPADLDAAAMILKRERVQALQVHTTPATITNRAPIAKLALELALPTISFYPVMTQAGLLMSYGDNRIASWRRAATYVDRLLRGERPTNLPVEQPTSFHLHINLKTARALGLTIPPTLLARADEVID